ncbi:MAG: hypothetical protein ACYC1I_11685 [Acidimicrobiales bacterium]
MDTTAAHATSWALKTQAMKAFDLNYRQLEAILATGRVRTRQLPGSFARVSLEDLEAVIEEMTVTN